MICTNIECMREFIPFRKTQKFCCGDCTARNQYIRRRTHTYRVRVLHHKYNSSQKRMLLIFNETQSLNFRKFLTEIINTKALQTKGFSANVRPPGGYNNHKKEVRG